MIVVKLREAMEAYRRRTGNRITYGQLAERTGLARATLESIASRTDYNASLRAVEVICLALDCEPADLLELRVTEQAEQGNAP